MFDENLVVIGTGIRTIGQLTMEAVAWIRKADRVLYIVSDPVAEAMIRDLNPKGAESLFGLYSQDQHRMRTYEQMVERTLECVRAGEVVCLAAYGHPGVFAYPTHEAIRRARAEGFRARMLPGISAEDCLFADLGIDPASLGCQTYEATDFLINDRLIDPSSNVVLWQIGGLGNPTFQSAHYELRGMPELLRKLYRYYPPLHRTVVYEAPIFPAAEPLMRTIPLCLLPYAGVTPISTLFIPPAAPSRTDVGLSQALGLAGA